MNTRHLALLALLFTIPAHAAECTSHFRVVGFLRSEKAIVQEERSCEIVELYRLDLKTGAVTPEATILGRDDPPAKAVSLRQSRWKRAQAKLFKEGFTFDVKKAEVRLSLPNDVIITEEDREVDNVRRWEVVARKGDSVRALARSSSPSGSDPLWLDEVRLTPDGTSLVVLIGGTVVKLTDSIKVIPVDALFEK